jgi:hypothetical protein
MVTGVPRGAVERRVRARLERAALARAAIVALAAPPVGRLGRGMGAEKPGGGVGVGVGDACPALATFASRAATCPEMAPAPPELLLLAAMTVVSAPRALALVAAFGGAEVEEVRETRAVAALLIWALERPAGAAALAARLLARLLAMVVCRELMLARVKGGRAAEPLAAAALARLLVRALVAATAEVAALALLLLPLLPASELARVLARLSKPAALVTGGRGASAGIQPQLSPGAPRASTTSSAISAGTGALAVEGRVSGALGNQAEALLPLLPLSAPAAALAIKLHCSAGSSAESACRVAGAAAAWALSAVHPAPPSTPQAPPLAGGGLTAATRPSG